MPSSVVKILLLKKLFEYNSCAKRADVNTLTHALKKSMSSFYENGRLPLTQNHGTFKRHFLEKKAPNWDNAFRSP